MPYTAITTQFSCRLLVGLCCNYPWFPENTTALQCCQLYHFSLQSLHLISVWFLAGQSTLLHLQRTLLSQQEISGSAGFFHSRFSISASSFPLENSENNSTIQFWVSLLKVEKLSPFYIFQKSGFILLFK